MNFEQTDRIAEALGFTISRSEREAFRGELEDMFDGLDELDAHTDDVSRPPVGEPVDDPYNAIRHRCNVTADTTGPLSGYRFGIKDNISVAGTPLDCGSTALSVASSRNATAVDRLLDAGGEITCKTNMDEFAGSVRGTTSAHGPVRNPHDTERTAGGSSGGSAVAVATDAVDLALGTDTGGSVRIPASFCGVFGLKPTYGRIPLSGIVEHTYLCDHVGIIGDSIDDIWLALSSLAGPDDQDPLSQAITTHEAYEPLAHQDEEVRFNRSPETLTVGVVTGLDQLQQPVRDVFDRVVDRLDDRNYNHTRVGFGDVDRFAPPHKVLSMCSLAAYWRSNGVSYRRGGVSDSELTAGIAQTKSEGSANQLSTYVKAKLVAGELLNRQEGG